MQPGNHDIPALDIDRIAEVCRTWSLRSLAAFGSRTNGTATAGSDLDLIAEFSPDREISLFDLDRIERQLSAATGMRVDLVDRRAIERSRNPLIRRDILTTAEPIYVAA